MRQVVVDVGPVDGCEAPELKRKPGGVQGDAHASAERVDKCFCTPISGLFTSIGCLFFDMFLQEVTVDRLGEVFTSSIRAENGRHVANSCDGTLNGWQKFVLGFVKLYAHEP
jgi:hypothetical protein